MSSITYSERIKIETFCELGLSNIQMGVRINFKIFLGCKINPQAGRTTTLSVLKNRVYHKPIF
ncbi:hypothetical protein WP50_38500 [Lactiplantibacillus plantarum]|nr:hypothetical protein WP50_38500 [Lactiplantibacillus plantarum]